MKIQNKQKGFTLLELMVTIAIVGVLFGLAAPNFSNALARSAGREAISNFQESFYFAQSEAMRLQNTVRLCASANGAICQNVDFTEGWIVAEVTGPNPTDLNILRDVPQSNIEDLTITSGGNRRVYEFNGAGRLRGLVGDTLTFAVIRGGNALYDRTLTLNTEGRIQ